MTLTPSPYQATVLAIPAHWNIFLGGGRGGGKTHGSLMVALRHIEKYKEHARVLCIRESWKASTEIAEKMHDMLIDAYGVSGVRYNKTEGIMRVNNGALFEVGQLEGQKDVRKYIGRSASLAIFDEAGQVADPRYINMIRGSIRAPAGVPLREIRTANPGDPGHAMLHKTHVTRAPAWAPYELDGETWVNAPSTYLDNNFIDQEEYAKRITAAAGNDPAILASWLRGDWSVGKGAYFALLDEKVHMLKTAWPWPVTKAWRPFLSMDFGTAAPTICALCLSPNGEEGPFPKDSLILLDELAVCEADNLNQGLHWPISKTCEAILEMCGKWNFKHPHGVSDDFAGIDQNLLAILQEHGLDMRRADKGRIAGWSAMRQMLTNAAEKNGLPGMWITARCEYFWQTVPFLERDPKRPEDLITNNVPDHAADMARFAVMHTGYGHAATSGRQIIHPLGGRFPTAVAY